MFYQLSVLFDKLIPKSYFKSHDETLADAADKFNQSVVTTPALNDVIGFRLVTGVYTNILLDMSYRLIVLQV